LVKIIFRRGKIQAISLYLSYIALFVTSISQAIYFRLQSLDLFVFACQLHIKRGYIVFDFI